VLSFYQRGGAELAGDLPAYGPITCGTARTTAPKKSTKTDGVALEDRVSRAVRDVEGAAHV
jgi:hypothetical protein